MMTKMIMMIKIMIMTKKYINWKVIEAAAVVVIVIQVEVTLHYHITVM